MVPGDLVTLNDGIPRTFLWCPGSTSVLGMIYQGEVGLIINYASWSFHADAEHVSRSRYVDGRVPANRAQKGVVF